MVDPTTLCEVISVFDADGNGGDFAYTVGLRDLNLAELVIRARPSEGDDPGADWILSHRDRHAVLMYIVQELVEGRLRVGDEFTQTYDDGLATVTYRLDPPEPAEDHEAYAVGPGVVTPLRWRLERPPIAEDAPLTDEMLRWIDERHDLEYRTETAISLRTGHAGSALRLDEHGLELGPAASVVRCVAAQMAMFDKHLVNSTVFAMFAGERGGWHHGHIRALLAAHARAAGRLPAHEAARELADRVVSRLLGSLDRPRPLLREVLANSGFEDLPSDRSFVLDLMGDFARTTLAAEAVADVVPTDVYLSATAARDLVLVDRDIRTLTSSRCLPPRQHALAARPLRSVIGGLPAAALRPYLTAIARLTPDERAEWSFAALQAEFAAIHQRRSLGAPEDLWQGTRLGARLQQQRQRIIALFTDGKDINKARERHVALSEAIDALVMWATLPSDAPIEVVSTLERPIPREIRAQFRRDGVRKNRSEPA